MHGDRQPENLLDAEALRDVADEDRREAAAEQFADRDDQPGGGRHQRGGHRLGTQRADGQGDERVVEEVHQKQQREQRCRHARRCWPASTSETSTPMLDRAMTGLRPSLSESHGSSNVPAVAPRPIADMTVAHLFGPKLQMIDEVVGHEGAGGDQAGQPAQHQQRGDAHIGIAENRLPVRTSSARPSEFWPGADERSGMIFHTAEASGQAGQHEDQENPGANR